MIMNQVVLTRRKKVFGICICLEPNISCDVLVAFVFQNNIQIHRHCEYHVGGQNDYESMILWWDLHQNRVLFMFYHDLHGELTKPNIVHDLIFHGMPQSWHIF
jgi:hypothetical protein